MEPDNFCYWLQGFFELSGATTLTAEQVDCVMRHSDLVLTLSQHRKQSVPAIITEIRTLLRIIDAGSSERITAEIKRVLNDQFQHVIDPEAGPEGVQAQLNEIHTARPLGARPDYNKPVFRC